MASLQIRDVDHNLIKRLKTLARRERRTLSHQVLFVLEQYLETQESTGRDLATASERLRDFWSEEWIPAPELPLPSREPEPDRDTRIGLVLEED